MPVPFFAGTQKWFKEIFAPVEDDAAETRFNCKIIMYYDNDLTKASKTVASLNIYFNYLSKMHKLESYQPYAKLLSIGRVENMGQE